MNQPDRNRRASTLAPVPLPAPISSPHLWREGELLVVERNQPLPDVCWLSGQPATRRVRCLFHHQTGTLHGAHGELAMILELIRYYLQDVPKALVEVPLADNLIRKRFRGWIYFGLTVIAVCATIAGLVLGQLWIQGLPPGPQQRQLREWVPPAVALGGFGLIATFAALSYYTMPMPTARLRAIRITETHVWLKGAPHEFMARLDAADPELPEAELIDDDGDDSEEPDEPQEPPIPKVSR